jgi:plasmid stabilization system protein ParE
MNFTIEILEKASQEFYESWAWYEEKQTGLGDRFEQAFFDKADSVTENPMKFSISNKYRKSRYREAPLDDFPFIIVYQIDERNSLILVHSIFHTSRYPGRKYK